MTTLRWLFGLHRSTRSRMGQQLKTSLVGSGSQKIVFLHGLLGRGRNFTRIAKELGEDTQTLLIDLPNHGASFWTESFDYRAMADLAAEAVADYAQGQPVVLIGHSMGGKIAMLLALYHPQLVSRLVVIDIAPGLSKGSFEVLMDGMLSLPIETYSRRSQADADLAAAVPNAGTRAFLLQNLVLARGPENPAHWEPNLAMLRRDVDAIMGWPEGVEASFDQPVLWLVGGDSPYVTEADLPVMKSLFPAVRKTVVKGTGHWVHVDKPEETIQILRAFLAG